MKNQDNVAGLGKNHDKEAHDNDLAKKQSEAKPATENLDMMPNSVNKDGSRTFSQNSDTDQSEIHNKAKAYAKEEHDKASNWENPST